MSLTMISSKLDRKSAPVDGGSGHWGREDVGDRFLTPHTGCIVRVRPSNRLVHDDAERVEVGPKIHVPFSVCVQLLRGEVG